MKILLFLLCTLVNEIHNEISKDCFKAVITKQKTSLCIKHAIVNNDLKSLTKDNIV